MKLRNLFEVFIVILILIFTVIGINIYHYGYEKNTYDIETLEQFFRILPQQIEERIKYNQSRANNNNRCQLQNRLYPAILLENSTSTYVYKCSYDNIDFAIKRSKAPFAECNEVEIGRKLRHRNIVKVYKAIYSECKSFFYIFMEYLPESLSFEQFRDNKYARIMEVVLDIAHALDYMNKNYNLTHNDLKIENIRGIKKNGVITWKLIDFGYALFIPTGNECNYNMGTITYMAPETLLYNKITQRTDMWSLGMLIYYLEVDEYNIEFPESNVDWTGDMWHEHKIDLKSRVRSSKFKNILTRLLRKDPNKRVGPEKLKSLLITIYNVKKIKC